MDPALRPYAVIATVATNTVPKLLHLANDTNTARYLCRLVQYPIACPLRLCLRANHGQFRGENLEPNDLTCSSNHHVPMAVTCVWLSVCLD